MSGRGLLLALPTSLVVAYLVGIPAAYIFLLGGMIMGPIYWLAWEFASKIRVGKFIDGATSVAELGMGAWLTFLLWLSVTLGA
jgi:hypothetical protein